MSDGGDSHSDNETTDEGEQVGSSDTPEDGSLETSAGAESPDADAPEESAPKTRRVGRPSVH